MEHHKFSTLKGCLTAGLLLGASLVAILYIGDLIETRPANLFRKFVADPIPQGVTIHQAESRLGNAVVFLTFEIGRNELDAIAERLELRQAPRQNPIQPPQWFIPSDHSTYWKGHGGTRELWYSTESQIACFKQVNP